MIGDTVNVAARLCQRARAGEIVLSDSFKRSLDDREGAFSIAALSQVIVRGRSEPVDIFCLPLQHRIPPMDPKSIARAELQDRRLGFRALPELRIAG